MGSYDLLAPEKLGNHIQFYPIVIILALPYIRSR